MNMVKSKLIFLNLVMTVIAVKYDYDLQERQLHKKGTFQMDWDKTEAFMHAFYKLSVPNDVNYRNISKGLVNSYQNELWNRFYEVFKNHLQFMFDHPCNWYLGNEPKGPYQYNVCKESKEKALEGMFLKLRTDATPKYIRARQRDYMDYVGPLIGKYIKYTSARGPSEFCYDIESPALPLPVDQNGKVDISLIVEEKTQFQTDSISQIESSSGVDKPVRDFDLNQLPPDEAE